MSKRIQLSRRSFLAGAGAMSASSALWSMLRGQSLARAGGSASPKRVVFWFVPEGMEAPFFWPQQTGPLNINMDTQLEDGDEPDSDKHHNWVIQPLKSFESRISLTRGFDIDWQAADSDYHQGAMKATLTGSGGDSMDELIGAELQGEATLPFVRLGVQGWFVGDPGYRRLFYKNDQGIEVNWNVAQTYNNIFPGGIPQGNGPNAEQLRQRRVLGSRLDLIGATRQSLAAVECAGGKDARSRLELYLQSLETVEQQTNSILDNPDIVLPQVNVEVPAGADQSSFWRNDANLRDVGKLMMDVAVATLALDRSRHVTLQWSSTGVDRHDGYDFIEGLENPGFGDHALAHTDQGRPQDSIRRDRARVFRWYAEQLNYFLTQLDAIPDGNGTLLDNTAVVWVSESMTIDHSLLFPSEMDLPLLVAGTAGGAFKTGQYWDDRNGNNRRSNGDFLLSIAKGLGSSIDSVGIGDTPFADILA